MKYKKLKPLLKSYILKTWLENYNKRSKNSKKLQSCIIRHVLKKAVIMQFTFEVISITWKTYLRVQTVP